MKDLINYIASHQITVLAIAFFSLLALYFVIKHLIKLALFFILIALAVGGYYYFKDPEKMPENIRKTIHDTRATSGKLLESGKKAYKTSKDIYKKGKEITKEVTKEASDFLRKKEEKQDKEQNSDTATPEHSVP